MAKIKSPFLVFNEFISPKMCEHFVDGLGFYSPDVNKQGKPIKMYRTHENYQFEIFKRLQILVPQIMNHYNTQYRGTEEMIFEYLAEGTVSEPICENSNYLKKKWVRTKDRDITCVIFLSDYNQELPFDSDYEVYGGKLEFPQHNFSFHPIRGTMIIYPSCPHFINANSKVEIGDLFQVRIHIATFMPFLYQPSDFPGNYKLWFKNL